MKLGWFCWRSETRRLRLCSSVSVSFCIWTSDFIFFPVDRQPAQRHVRWRHHYSGAGGPVQPQCPEVSVNAAPTLWRLIPEISTNTCLMIHVCFSSGRKERNFRRGHVRGASRAHAAVSTDLWGGVCLKCLQCPLGGLSINPTTHRWIQSFVYQGHRVNISFLGFKKSQQLLQWQKSVTVNE